MIERWLPVLNHDHFYEVSDRGNVRRVFGGKGAIKGRILKTRLTKDGYVKYMLYSGTKLIKPKAFLAHRLVIEAFVRKLSETDEVDHLNMIRDDNQLANLEIVTRTENAIRSFSSGKRNMVRGSRQGLSVTNEETVYLIKKLLKEGRKQNSLAKEFGLSVSLLNRIARGKTWRHVNSP